MSNTSSTHTVNVDSNIKQTTKEAEGLNAALGKAAATAQRIASPVANARKAKNMDAGAELGRESGIARSIGPGTGASGRDFAKQSEGLGGLVRVYATFAANIFAATAAFGALSRAADTTNLVKGLDQLGAASGRNLGSLSKQLVSAADGAISLRDAMTSVAQASAGGMSNANIVKMAEVAKRAAQALGRDMPDALNRLTRGITKLEPELLDEIGIMIRLDTTTLDYAKSVGKSVTALTMFEKRQAFANAVLAQGAEKFGEIELSANAYSKILASSQNLLQSGLELVNKVLTPLVSLLAQSPTGLAVTLAAIAGTLLKQAIPAIGTYRKNMQAAADESLIRLSKVYKDQQALTEEADSLAADSASAAFRRQADTIKRISDLRQSAGLFSKTSRKDWGQIAGKNPFEITPEELKSLDDRAARMLANTDKIIQAEGAAMKQHIADMRALRTQDNIIHENTQAKIEDADSRGWTHRTQLAKIYDKEIQNASNRRILALTSETAATMGPVRAWKLLNQEIAKSKAGESFIMVPKLDENGKETITNGIAELEKRGVKATGLLSNGFTRLRGAIGIATSAVSTFMNAFGVWFQVIGLVIAGASILNEWWSKNNKESEEFYKSLDTLSGAGKSLDRTLESISKKDPLASISTAAISARAEAVKGLGEAFAEAVVNLKVTDEVANSWDRFTDEIKSWFGGGLLKNSAKEFSVEIAKVLNASSGTEAGGKASTKLRDIIGVDPKNISELYTELSKSPERILEITPKISAVLRELGNELSIVASRAKQLDDSFTEAGKVFDSIVFSAIPSDNIAKLGMSFITVGKEMTEALKDPIVAMNNLATIAGDISKLRFLNPETAKELYNAAPKIKENTAQLVAQTNALEKLNERQAEVDSKISEARKWAGVGIDNNSVAVFQRAGVSKEEVTGLAQVRQNLLSAILASKQAMQPYADKLVKAQNDIFINGADYIESAIAQGFAKAALTVDKTFASLLSGNTGSINAQEDIGKREIALRIEGLNITKSLIDSQEDLRRQVEEASIIQREVLLVEQKKDPSKFGKTADEIEGELKDLKTRLRGLTILKTGVFDGPKGKDEYKRSLAGEGSIEIETSDAKRSAAQGYTGTYNAKRGIEAQIAAEAANIQSLAIEKIGKQISLNYSKEKDLLSVKSSNLERDLAMLDAKTKLLPYLDKETISKRQQLLEEQAINKFISDRKNLEEQVVKAGSVLSNSNASERARIRAGEELLDLQIKINQFDTKADNDRISRNLIYSQQVLDATKKEFDTKVAISNTLFSIETNNENIRISLQEEALASLEATGAASKQFIANQSASIALAKEELRSREAIKKAEQDIATAKFEKKTIVAQGPVSPEMTEKQDEAIKAGENILANEVKLTEAKKATIVAQKESNQLLADQEERMEKIKDFSESLGEAFGELGSIIGQVGINISDMLSRQETYSAALKKQQDIVEQVNDIERSGMAATTEEFKTRETAQKEIGKLSSKNTRQEIEDTAKIIGSTKMLFKEKTGAYKVLSAVEKALHVARIAMMIKEVVTALATTGPVVGSNMAKAASGGITATIDAMKGLTTPFNFIAGAAMAAYVASILTGGKGSAPPLGATAAEQQSTQGTDQYYENGALVSTGAGVLGDKTAKSESVVKGIETLSKHSFDTLVYSNKMLDALIHIEENTKAFVGTLLKRIPGLTTPAQGTESGNWFSGKTTTNVIDQGIILSGTLGELADGFGKIIKYTNTVTEDDGLFGFIGGGTDYSGALETIQDADLTKFVGLMIGDMGIALSEAGTTLGMGTAKDIITGFRSLDLGNVLKTSIMGLDGAESAEELLAVISSGLDVGAKKLFPTLNKFWTDPSESFADTLIRLANNMTTVDLSLESIGMSIEKVAETGARASIEQLQKVTIAQQKYNEALADTQNTYVVSGTSEYGDSTYTWQETKTVNPNAAANLEAASAALTAAIAEVERASVGFTTNNIDLYESLIKASGGLDKFVERNEFFTSNFLTEAERLAPIQARVTEMMTTLGYASIDTREGFANIVKGLDLTDEAQRNTYIGLMSVAKGFAEVHPETRKVVSAEEGLAKLRSQQIEIAKLEGRATDALNMERADILKELATYGNAELITNQNRIFLLQDEAKARKLNTDLLAAEGKGYDNLLAIRAEELRTLTDAERVIKNQIYAAQDLEKLHKLDIDLLQAQGKASEALAMSRIDELKSLSPLEQETKKLIYAEQDLSKTKGLQVSLLEAEGKAYEALLIKREQELIALSDTDKAIQTLINSTQDMQKTADLETAALSAMGYTYEATYRTRQKELLALSDTDKAIQQFINTQTDLLVTAGLEAELMEASGDAAGALYARRKQELRGLSATDQVLKIRIWRLQDEAALLATFNSQQIKAMELLGNKAGALALTRKLELETIDSQLRPHQEYIYALEDEASLKEELIQAYDKESSAIKNTISTLEDSSRALKDYKNSLMLSDKSTAKPDEKYKLAKQLALDTAARATGPATTEAEIKARDAAVAKLPEATDAWLEASRTLYASSQSYSNDYSLALSLLDTVGASLDSQLSDAQKQLSELEESNGYLNSIAETTRSVEQIMADLLLAQEKTAAALANLPAGTTWGNSGVSATNVGATMTAGESGIYGALDSIVTGTAGYVNTIEGARKDLLSTTTLAEDMQLYNTTVANGFTSTMVDAILGAEPGTALRWALERGFPAFAKGGYASGDALVGEQGPELVDFNSPGRVYSANNTAAMLGNTAELINEIKSLRQEVAKLREEQKEQTGHLIQSNYDANAKAAEKVVEGTQDASNAAIWKIKSAPKVA